MLDLVVWLSLVPPLPALALSAVVDGPAALPRAIASAAWSGIAAVLYLGLVATVLAYAVWGDLLRRYPAATVAPFALLVPCVGTLSSSAVFGERFPHRAVGVVDPGLVDEDGLGEEPLGQHALDDLRPDVLGLRGYLGQLLVDPALLHDRRLRHVLALEVTRLRGCDLHCDEAGELRRGPRADEHEALFGSVLLPLLMSTGELCGGFDWDDGAFARAYGELEKALFGEGHQYGAVAPVIGITTGGVTIELGEGLRVRLAATGELAKLWPEANGLLPMDFGREPDRLCIIELERALDAGATEPPDAPGEFADAITAIRLATAAPIAAGPVLFERLDWRPYGIRPVLPIAATQPAGEPTRLDSFRAGLAADLLPRLTLADDDPELGEALDRWELSLFQDGPFQAEQLRESLSALLGGNDGLWAAAVRGAILLGETGRARAELQDRLSGDPDPDVIRRALVETLRHGDRAELVASLDESILGLRPRPLSATQLPHASTG